MSGDLVYAHGDIRGLEFLLPAIGSDSTGGLVRKRDQGHFGAIVGRGGSGKSILALQIITQLLNHRDDYGRDRNARPSAFYFTLEANPEELATQVAQFSWGDERYRERDPKAIRARKPEKDTRIQDWQRMPIGSGLHRKGLYLVGLPSPADGLNALNLQIRQVVSGQLDDLTSLEAIVIDPMGAINTVGDLRTDLNQLKELASSHRTFVFLLAEQHAFAEHPSIEHYSQSIIHLEHDPSQQRHRRLHIQKARGQSFRSGYHYFELQASRGTDAAASKGVLIYPSIEGQSAYAHERLSLGQGVDDTGGGFPFFPRGSHFLEDQIQPGSAIFLMGPPGTFKEYIASQFAAAANGATLYVSFKTDFLSTKRGLLQGSDYFDQRRDVPPLTDLKAVPYFFDARSPLMTPEEMLFTIRNAIKGRSDTDQGPPGPRFRRAVVWGLRRLYDFPYFGEDRALQFLEALVTLLRAHRIVTLLVDWPDSERPSTVPIVDLCQYIFLTRVCVSPDSPDVSEPIRTGLRSFWGPNTVEHVAFLRAQRTRDGVQLNQGSVIKRERASATKLRTNPYPGSSKGETFQYRWLYYGKSWEKDHSLLS